MSGVRVIGPKKGLNTRGKTLSFKSGKVIFWESKLERDYIRLLDFDPNVEDFFHQPLTIEYFYKGKKRRYTPDFKVITRDNKISIVEVKPQNKIQIPDNQVKFHVGQQFCNQQGWKYLVASEEQIRIGKLQENISILRHAFNKNYSKSSMKVIIECLTQLTSGSILELEEACKLEKYEFYETLYSMIFTHQIKVDLRSEKLTPYTVVELYS